MCDNEHDLQALNNWGLVLQEISTMGDPAERVLLVQQSVSKFRRAIRLRPEFDRACYNLGTVYYAHACSLQNEVQSALAQPEQVGCCKHMLHLTCSCHMLQHVTC